MHSENFRRRVLLSSLALGLCALGALAVRVAAPTIERRGSLYCVEEGADLYTFDAVWRTETVLRDTNGNGIRTPVEAPSPEELDRLRGRLLSGLGMAGLERIPAEGTQELQAIRSLGYL